MTIEASDPVQSVNPEIHCKLRRVLFFFLFTNSDDYEKTTSMRISEGVSLTMQVFTFLWKDSYHARLSEMYVCTKLQTPREFRIY